jgi:hypothetical protein
MGEEIKQDPFTFDPKMDLNPSDDNANAPIEVVLELSIKDPHYFKLATKFMILLYQGYELNMITNTLMIFNTCATQRHTNGFIDKLLSLLRNSILPKLNNLPESHYEAKSLIQNLGLRYITIHSCENGCVLYHKDHVAVKQCPICGQP